MKLSTTVRLGCVDFPAFPLQLLLRRHPEWRAYPAAVVEEDKPQGLLLWVNEKARRQGVLPGLRYAAAFSLASTLRAGQVLPAEIDKAIDELVNVFMRFTPEVESASEEPGVFWLNGAGLKRLHGSLQQWADAIYQNLRRRGFAVNLAVGFTRFGTYAIAKANKGATVVHDPEAERTAACKAPLQRLNIEAEFRNALFKLGIKTIGDLFSLAPGGLRERFGKEAHQLYHMAIGDLWMPLEPKSPEEPLVQKCILDDPEDDATRLLFVIKQSLHLLLAALAKRYQALVTLWISFVIDHGDRIRESLCPAAPTLDVVQIADLVRLRLESLQLDAGVVEIELTVESCAATREQLSLFERSVLDPVEGPRRNLEAANRALARVRAEFGDESVVCAKLNDGHLPEARFIWEPLQRVQSPKPKPHRVKTLIRRVRTQPQTLEGAPLRSHEDGWLLGAKYGAVDKLAGPYIFSGGWWNREIQREYYYAETRNGDLLWLYYDRIRRKWFLQGAVE
ncbi:MAG TPA: DNA polymerase Y family protein [Candidatus Binatia bacterium]|jgi:protein ImuB